MLKSPPTRELRSWTTDSTRWQHYKPRPGDIVISTPPKCGTTWMQQIVSLLVFCSPEPRPVQLMSPWLDARFLLELDEALVLLEAQTHRRFIKAHLPFDALPDFDEVQYINVGRHGLDAFMSWFNHVSALTTNALDRFDSIGLADERIARPYPRMPAEVRAFFDRWMDDDPSAIAHYPASMLFATERSFWAQRAAPNLLMVHYGDLKADLTSEMQRIAEFLQIAIPDAVWPSLVEAARFETMKKNGAAILPRSGVTFDGAHERFLFKGTNGRWRDALSSEQIARYEARAKRELSPNLARWMEHGRLVVGEPRDSAD